MTEAGAVDVRERYRRRCEDALLTALDGTPLYAAWRARDPGPGHDLDERFAALPILFKEDIRSHFPYGLVPRGRDLDAGHARGEVSFVRTSGTAEEALDNIWSQPWWDASERASWSLNSAAARIAAGSQPGAPGAFREAILASALSVGPRSAGAPLATDSRRLGRFLFLNEYGRTDEWPDGHEARMAAELARYQPDVFEANPSLLARLGRWAADHGTALWQPALVTLTYEYPSELHLRAIRSVFRCPIASSYGSTEAGYVFMECECGRLHQNTETCRVDLVPLTRGVRAVEPGGLGRILATTFGNPWFQLLRFEVGDVGRLAPDACPCGRGMGMTLSAIEGRIGSICVATGGALLTHRSIDLALAAVPGLQQYHLDQGAPDLVSCSVIPEKPGLAGRVADGAREALSSLFGTGVRVDVKDVPVLLPGPSGKFVLVRRSFELEDELSHA
jgi:phenylacetate-CoA ligase